MILMLLLYSCIWLILDLVIVYHRLFAVFGSSPQNAVVQKNERAERKGFVDH